MTDLTASDIRVLSFLEDTAEEQLAFARELIATPSPNPPGGEQEVAAVVTARLERLGVNDISELAKEAGRPNLIVRIPGEADGPTLVLSGHIDTKPAGDMARWETDPWDPVIRDGNLYGLGSGDMKVAVAAMVYAGAALSRVSGWSGELQLVFTADEEAGSNLGSKWMAEQGYLEADAAIIGEPCGVVSEWENIGVVSRGAALVKIEVVGTQMHSSVSDRFNPVNATVEMAWLIQRMHAQMKGYLTYEPHRLGGPGPTVNVGVMSESGVFYGVYPGNGWFACDIRLIPGMTVESVTADIQRFLDDAMAANPRLQAKLTIEGGVPATEIPFDHPVVTAIRHATSHVLEKELEPAIFPGATDAYSFQATAGIPSIAAFGPGYLPRAHAPNEHLAVNGVYEASRIYALAALRYFASEKTG
ncbi:MAG: M20/M25/M40 family metallo-hydrolase [Actinomycetia bacterium]|nr:M20/M25/M40 family metallo-hydrolase [Actinomycetes bacterium]